jgi:ABC-2 type transport system permease protein
MKNIMSNAFRLFTRDKTYVSMLTVLPIVLFLLMSVLLPYTEKHSIAVINRTDDNVIQSALEEIEGIKIQDVDEDNIAESLISGRIELAVVIDVDPVTGQSGANIISNGDSEILGSIELAVANASDKSDDEIVEVNSVKKHKHNLSSSSAFMLFKFITGGNLLGAFLIMERKRRVKDRIMMSGIGIGKYICGTSLVYLIGTFVGSFIYFLVALLFDYDFGMRSPWQYLIMVCLSNILSVGIYVFASSLTDDSQTLESMATLVLMPMGIFSGVLFPFDYMPKVLKIIGSCCPQRWISHGIERIQETGSFTSALTDVALILGLSVILFVIGAYRNGKRTAH